MKTLVVVFALCAVAFAHPRPAPDEQESEEDAKSGKDTEFFVVPLERAAPPRFGLDSFGPPSTFQRHPFFSGGLFGRPDLEDARPDHDDFMTQMQEMLKEMRKQLTDLVQHAHGVGAHGEDGEAAVGTRIGDGEAGDLPQNKTTSTTKVIDGHVVTVNETTYSSGDDGIGAVFRIKVVEVHPSEGPEGPETEGEENGGDKESTEDSQGAEEKPEKSPEDASPEREPTTGKTLTSDHEDKHEETNEIPNHSQVHDEWAGEFDPSNNDIDDVIGVSQEWDEEGPRKGSYHDLRGDTRVNDFVSDQAQSQGMVMMEPNAEFVQPRRQYYRYEAMPQRTEELAH